MQKKPSNPPQELGFIAPPDPVGGTSFISGLRLWAEPRLPFNHAQADYLYGGPQAAGDPLGTYSGGRYDDEYYPSQHTVDESNFATSEADFDSEFAHWSNMTSYPTLNGEPYPKGPAYKVLSGEITGSSASVLTYHVAPSQIQWLWLYFYAPSDGQDSPDFNIRVTVNIDDGGSLVTANSAEFSNPTFGRLCIRSRQSLPRYSLRLVIERFTFNEDDANGVLPFRLAGRLGRFRSFPENEHI